MERAPSRNASLFVDVKNQALLAVDGDSISYRRLRRPRATGSGIPEACVTSHCSIAARLKRQLLPTRKPGRRPCRNSRYMVVGWTRRCSDNSFIVKISSGDATFAPRLVVGIGGGSFGGL